MIEHILLATALVTSTPDMPALLRHHSVESSRGYEPSSYRGHWFDKKVEPIRKCVLHRESRSFYGAARGGAYQFQAWPHWPRSNAWMMKPEIRKTYGKAEANRAFRILSAHPMDKWSRWAQDFAFYRVWNFGKGKAHWNHIVPGTECFSE